jgi:hypothetical protein
LNIIWEIREHGALEIIWEIREQWALIITTDVVL